MLVKRKHQPSIQNMKAIHGEIQHALVIADIDKKKIRKVVRKTCAERRMISLLKYEMMRKRFEEKVMTLVDVGVPNLCGHFKDGILKACGEVCVRRSKGRYLVVE